MDTNKQIDDCSKKNHKRDLDAEMQKVVSATLASLSAAMGEYVNVVYVATLQDDDWLLPWASFQLRSEAKAVIRFYVGSDANLRDSCEGVGGEVYKTRKLQVGKMEQDEFGIWKCSLPKFIDFEPDRADPPYKSLIVLPLVIEEDQKAVKRRRKHRDRNRIVESERCLGVLCIESTNPDSFDSSDIQDQLTIKAGMISGLMDVGAQLVRLNAEGATAD